jgi:hypothetical protein
MVRFRLGLVIGLLPTFGCSTEPCADPGGPGIAVEVRDADTGAPAANGATAVVTQGQFTETLERVDDLHLIGLVDGEGTFDLIVTKPGYQAFEVSGIEVENECGADPVQIEAELIPE